MKRIHFFAIMLLTIFAGTSMAQQFWHKTGGPLGGAVADISADSSGRIWISILRDGAWYSDDHGTTWDSVTRGLPSPNLKSIAASNDGYVYCTSINYFYAYRLNTNKPRADWAWEDITPQKDRNNAINDIATTPEGYIAMSTGLVGTIVSKDHGDTWKTISTDAATLLAVGKKQEYAYYKTSDRKVYLTQNEGATWDTISKVLPQPQQGATKMQIARSQTQMTIVMGTRKNLSGETLGGRIWTYPYTATPADTGWIMTYQGSFNPEGGKNDDHVDDLVKVQMMKTISPDILFACYHGRTLRSLDLGMTWQTMDSIKRGDEPFQMTAEKNDQGDVYLYQESEPDGIHRSTDHGVTWEEELNEGLNLHYMFAGGIDTVSPEAKALSSQSYLYAVIEFGLCTSSDAGATWHGPEEFGTESYSNALWVSPNGTPIAGTDAGVFISKDHGQSVELVAEGHLINSMTSVLDNLNHITWVYAAFSDTLIRSSDNGLTWQPAPRAGMGSNNTNILALAGSVDTIICGLPGGYYRSVNAGATWSQISRPNLDLNPVKLIIHTDGSYIAYLPGAPSNGGGAWRSSDGGQNWLHIFPTESTLPIPTDFFGINSDSRGTIFICSDSGLYRSHINDQSYTTWDRVGSGLYFDDLEYTQKEVNTSEIVEHRTANGGKGRYYAITRGLSVWYSDNMNTTGSVRLPSASKAATVTSYPNPFVSETNIQFKLTSGSQVHIQVLDAVGRIVATIPTSFLGAGEHTIPFEATSLAAGNYMVVVRTGDLTQTGWITLTK